MKSRPLAIIVASAVTSALLIAAPAAAHAVAPSDLQDDVNAILAEHPGGEQIGPGEISWDDGAIVLTLEGAPVASRASAAAPAAFGGCASGAYCAWSAKNYTGSKLTFTGCSSVGYSNLVSALPSVRSIANARSSGHVTGGIHSLTAGSGLASVTGVALMTCYTS